MATSARTPPARQKKTASSAGTSTGGTPKTSTAKGKGGGSAKRPAASGAGSTRARRANPRRPVTKGPLDLASEGIVLAVSVVWMGLSRTVGHLFRRAGSGARNLHPDHRRDGIGMALLAAALIVGAAVWR